MRYVLLADNTRIDGCNDSTTSNSIFAVRDTYEDAGAVRDLFTSENAQVIRVFAPAEEEGGEDVEMVVGSNLVLLDGAKLTKNADGKFVCEIDTRVKTEMELINDRLTDVEDIVVEL